jgi:hypothetical protein
MPTNRSKTAAISRTKKQMSISEGFKYNCLHAYKNQDYTIVLDWLQYTCKFNTTFLALGTDFKHKDYRWLYQGHGTQHYKYLYHVYSLNNHVFTVQVSPKRSKHENIGIVKLENWLLYADWYSYQQDFANTCIDEIVRISRVDIALDGMNHIRELLHEATTQHGHNYKLIGKSKINPADVNRVTKKASGFNVGTSKGHKYISLYNKSKELKGNKPYIPDYWRKNGLTRKDDIYRFECRMKSGFLTRVLTPDKQQYTASAMLSELRSDGMKLSLIDLFLKGFFEFVYMDDTNVSRCRRIQIIPTAAFKHEKSDLQKKPTNYKSKLTVHNLYAQLCAGKANVEDSLMVMAEQLSYHDLYDWYASRLQDFDRLYVDETGKIKNVLHGLASLRPKTTLKTSDEDIIHSRWELYREVIPDISFDYRSRNSPVKDPYLCVK